MLGDCEWPNVVVDGDGGVSMIVVGVSGTGPTRRATFGGGLQSCKFNV